ncbi:hypothetical protein ENTCAN_08580 [Enterobacter cancerogenus ATCC 35316]|nr:hypothetical protein ENTCAN_08580 [Enterobacter cancerogenus ATCC 35316]
MRILFFCVAYACKGGVSIKNTHLLKRPEQVKKGAFSRSVNRMNVGKSLIRKPG